MARFAAVDVGTNTLLLTIAEERGGRLVPLEQRAVITRLGAGVDRTRRLDPAARARSLAVLAEFGASARGARATRIEAVCTSAVRDAEDGAAFVAEATGALGAPLYVVTGDDEAELTFEGALSGLDTSGPVTVFDVGGGSTEIITGEGGEPPTRRAAVSLDIGSVRLTERHVSTDPPSAEARAAIESSIAEALRRAPPLDPRATLVGVAGTVTTLATVHLGLDVYDAATVHGLSLEQQSVDALVERMVGCTNAERAALPGMEPKRADVIVAGALIVQAIVRLAGAAELRVSDRGVRWGLLGRMQRDIGRGTARQRD